MDIKTIAKNIRKYREEKGYTKKELAEKIGRSYITVRRYETGSVKPSAYTLTIIARVLGINMSDILSIKGDNDMDFKKNLVEYLFYYNHTVGSIIDIEEDINDLCEYLHDYENEDFDFQAWIKDNGLEQAYEEYVKCT